MNSNPTMTNPKRTAGMLAGVAFGAIATLALVATVRLAGDDSSADSPASERTSFAVGFSAATGLRDIVALSPEHFERGLRDGLAGDAASGVMDRRELFERLRQVTKAVAAAELAAISQRIDEEADR